MSGRKRLAEGVGVNEEEEDEALGSLTFCLLINEREKVVNRDGTASGRNVVGPSKSFWVKCSRQTLNVDDEGETWIFS